MFGLDKYGGIGLHRIARFFEERGIDAERLSERSIAITGSNGKGSTASLAAAALKAHGLNSGVFTSPHMFDICERFQFGERDMPRETFDRLAGEVLAFNDALPADDRLGAFQFLFLVAVLWFEETQPDVIVWEAGVGGRYDPIRCARAHVGAMTSVELEHTQILGATEELIAYDKTDAIAPGGKLVLSPAVQPSLYERIRVYCGLSGKTVLPTADTLRLSGLHNTRAGERFTLTEANGDERAASLALGGAHQAQNAVTALCLAEQWLARAGRAFDLDAALDALAKVSFPGRLQNLGGAPDLWIDVGHTPHALELVTEAYCDVVSPERTLAVFGASSAKEVRKMAEIVARSFPRVLLTQAHKGGADVAAFSDLFAAHGDKALIEPDITRAAALAREIAATEGLTVLAIGGLFLATEFQVAWQGGDPAALDFL